jgi:competence protein ComEC
MKYFRSFILFSFLLLASQTFTAEAGTLTVTWLDLPVHGLAVVLETPGGKVMLVDTGGVRAQPPYNAGRETIAPFLKARGHNAIDAIVISHPHSDHYGGAEWLLENMPVKLFVDHGYEGRAQTPDYTRLRALAQQRGAEYRVLHAGDALALDPALDIEVLSPPAEFIDAASKASEVSDHGLLNSNSIVLRVKHGDNVFLFPGDSYGGAFERQIQAHNPLAKLKATVLTANHHGFSPGHDFPRLVAPKFVVASCLADYPANANTPNTRSPGDNAMQVYGALGAEVFVTAFHGTITAVSDGQQVRVSKEHERASAVP